MARLPKPRKVNFKLIPPSDGGHEPEPYKLLTVVRDKYHEDLHEAHIALAWRLRLKPDKDGHLVLGKCVKASDLNREFAAYDFIIVLNEDAWTHPDFDKNKKMALLDHELSHAAPVLDKYDEPVIDERKRPVFRTRKHDIEEFRGVVAHFGCYKSDLERFPETLLKARMPLFEQKNGKSKDKAASSAAQAGVQ